MVSKFSTTESASSVAAKPLGERIAASRQLLQNPYAYLSDTGAYSALLPAEETVLVSAASKVTDSSNVASIQDKAFPKLRSKVPGGYTALLRNTRGYSRHTNIEIERVATDLQRLMWQDRDKIWVDTRISDPIDVLEPSVAFRLIEFDYDLAETLGQYFSDGKQVEVAGLIDDTVKLVRISRQFPQDVRKFTAAHELGHALLHDARGLHRDRPLNGTTIARDTVELEADKFASYFLMPGKLVRARFKQLFAAEVFSLNEETAFALTRGNSLDLKCDCKTLRDLSRILAGAQSYNGTHFISLASQFGVSTEAMAIRLEELGLLAV